MKILVLDNFMHKDVICEYLETTKREWFGIFIVHVCKSDL